MGTQIIVVACPEVAEYRILSPKILVSCEHFRGGGAQLLKQIWRPVAVAPLSP